MAIGDGTIYLGGDFTRAQGLRRNHLAAFDTAGHVTSFDPALLGRSDGSAPAVGVLLLTGRTLYVAGDITYAADAQRDGLAALDVVTGQARDWAPVPQGGWVESALMDDNGTLYLGGVFSGVSDLPSEGFAEFGPSPASSEARAAPRRDGDTADGSTTGDDDGAADVPSDGSGAQTGDGTTAAPSSTGDSGSHGGGAAPGIFPATPPTLATAGGAVTPPRKPAAGCRATVVAKARFGKRPAIVLTIRACAAATAHVAIRSLARGGLKAHATVKLGTDRTNTLVIPIERRPHGRFAIQVRADRLRLARTVRL